MTGTPASSRTLQTPDDLDIGDIITFRFLPQASLSGKNFQVTAINTADFKQGKFILVPAGSSHNLSAITDIEFITISVAI